MYDLTTLKKKTEETKEWLKKEYAGIRTGRATPALLDSVRVESYGSLMPLAGVASVNAEDARTLRITPWDASQVKAIEKAIGEAGLGVTVGSDEKGVRASFPELTSERREQLIKLMRAKHEEARVALRMERDRVWSDIQKKEKASEISEDEKFTSKEAMQKIIDAANADLDDLTAKKEKELTS